MTLTAAQQTANEQVLAKYVYFAEFHFLSGTMRVSTANITYTWGGFDWIGLGMVGGVSPIDMQLGVAAAALTFDLNISNPQVVALSVADVAEWRGRDAKLHFCPLDDQYRLIDTPDRCWQGTMDAMSGGISGTRENASGSIKLKCETSAYGMRRVTALRLSAAQHKLKYPNDTGLDRMAALVGKPTPWLSVKFQQR